MKRLFFSQRFFFFKKMGIFQTGLFFHFKADCFFLKFLFFFRKIFFYKKGVVVVVVVVVISHIFCKVSFQVYSFFMWLFFFSLFFKVLCIQNLFCFKFS